MTLTRLRMNSNVNWLDHQVPRLKGLCGYGPTTAERKDAHGNGLAPVPLRPGVSNGRLKRQAKTGDRHHLEDGERGGGGPVYGRNDGELLEILGRASGTEPRMSTRKRRLAEDEPSRISQGD